MCVDVSNYPVTVTAGLWHTARVSQSARMRSITPGEGTENRERPPTVSE